MKFSSIRSISDSVLSLSPLSLFLSLLSLSLSLFLSFSLSLARSLSLSLSLSILPAFVQAMKKFASNKWTPPLDVALALNNDNFQELYEQNSPTLVMFYAPW